MIPLIWTRLAVLAIDRRGAFPLGVGIKPQAQSSASFFRMMQGALQPVLKSDAQRKECSGLNSFLRHLDDNHIFWVERRMCFPQEQVPQL